MAGQQSRPDGATTIMLLNKYVTGSTPVSVSVAGRAASGIEAAQVWQLAGGSTKKLSDATVTDNKATLTLPAQSATLVVLPKPNTTTPSPTNTPPPTPVVTSSATTVPGTVGLGNPITAVVQVASAPIASAIVEVYDSAGRKVFQKYYEGLDFTAGQQRSYATSWTPAAAGTYTVKIGVFKAA